MKLFRDALELLFVIAIGGMLSSALRKLRHRGISPYTCPNCGRPTSRAYERCRHCGAQVKG